MKGAGRRDKMVPKRDSQRYCYQNEERMYGKRNKKERWRNKKMCCDQEEFCIRLESKELTHTSLTLSLPQRWTNSWKKSFLFFLGNSWRPMYKNSRVMTARGMCQTWRASDSKFKRTSTNEAEDSLTSWSVKDQHCWKATRLKLQQRTDTTHI